MLQYCRTRTFLFLWAAGQTMGLFTFGFCLRQTQMTWRWLGKVLRYRLLTLHTPWEGKVVLTYRLHTTYIIHYSLFCMNPYVNQLDNDLILCLYQQLYLIYLTEKQLQISLLLQPDKTSSTQKPEQIKEKKDNPCQCWWHLVHRTLIPPWIWNKYLVYEGWKYRISQIC